MNDRLAARYLLTDDLLVIAIDRSIRIEFKTYGGRRNSPKELERKVTATYISALEPTPN